MDADKFPVVLIFQKKTYKEQLLCYHLLLILNLVTIIIAFVPVHVYNFSSFFKKKAHSALFFHTEAQLSLKNVYLPPVFFFKFNSP